MKPLNPDISVVMAVFNGEENIEESVNSILRQTFKNFELIIIDDGSTDKSVEIITSFDDDRIQLYKQKNKGPALARNKGINLAKAKYIAIQDDDDISWETRLEKQFSYLESNPKVVAVGSWVVWIDEKGKFLATSKFPSKKAELRNLLPLRLPIPHAPSLYRKEVLKRIGGYKNLGVTYFDEDRLLMIDLSREGEFSNIQEVLYSIRITPSSNSQRSRAHVRLYNLIASEYFHHGILNQSKINKILSGSPSTISSRNTKTYYYNRIGNILITNRTNALAGFKFILFSILIDPLDIQAYKILISGLTPKKIKNLVKKHFYNSDQKVGC